MTRQAALDQHIVPLLAEAEDTIMAVPIRPAPPREKRPAATAGLEFRGGRGVRVNVVLYITPYNDNEQDSMRLHEGMRTYSGSCPCAPLSLFSMSTFYISRLGLPLEHLGQCYWSLGGCSDPRRQNTDIRHERVVQCEVGRRNMSAMLGDSL
jgi:hypothetical protein